MSSSPSLEPENSHIPDTSTRGASQGSSEAASVAAEDSVTKTPSTRVDAAKEAIAGQVRRLVVPRRSLRWWFQRRSCWRVVSVWCVKISIPAT